MTPFSRPIYEQINVPNAQISDLLPAVQLATSASRPGTDYGEAKARFLEAIQVRGLPPDRPCMCFLVPRRRHVGHNGLSK